MGPYMLKHGAAYGAVSTLLQAAIARRAEKQFPTITQVFHHGERGVRECGVGRFNCRTAAAVVAVLILIVTMMVIVVVWGPWLAPPLLVLSNNSQSLLQGYVFVARSFIQSFVPSFIRSYFSDCLCGCWFLLSLLKGETK